MRAAVVAAMTAALVVPAVSAAKGKRPTTGAGCKPSVMVVVKATAAADGTSSLTLTPSGGNHWARLLLGNGAVTQAIVNAAPGLRIQAGGNVGALSAIKKGDRVLVQYRACKADILGTKGANATTLSNLLGSLSPRKVIDLGTASGDEKQGEDTDDD
jgi:hypothetical protein